MTLKYPLAGDLSAMAFNEKAGRSQVDSSLASRSKVFVSRRGAAVAMLHPHSRGAIGFARCMLGVLGSAGAAICLAPCGSALAEWNLGQAIDAVAGTRLRALDRHLWHLDVGYFSVPTESGHIFLSSDHGVMKKCHHRVRSTMRFSMHGERGW